MPLNKEAKQKQKFGNGADCLYERTSKKGPTHLRSVL